MLGQITKAAVFLVVSAAIFAASYTFMNSTWAANFSKVGVAPDQRDFILGLRTNLPVTLGYVVCAAFSLLILRKTVAILSANKILLCAIAASAVSATYFFLLDFVQIPTNYYLTVLGVFSMPLVAALINLASINVAKFKW